MQRSPCHYCYMAAADKNGPECLHCEKRCAYVESLEGRNGPVPMEMTDMTKRRFTEEDDRTILTAELSTKQIAQNLGRTVSSIYVRRSVLGNKKPDPSPITVAVPGGNSKDAIINLEDHPDVLDQLRKRAADELRTVHNQALWFIKCALQGGAPDHRRAPDRAP